MEKDVSWKEYFRDDERYADVINGIGCGGLQLVAGEDLQEAEQQTILGRMFGLAGRGKRKLLELVQSDEHFKQMEEYAYEVVTNYVRAEELIQVKEEYSREDGRIDMCQALKELLADERMEGREEGREEGRMSGLAEGRSDAIKSIVIKMVQKGKSDEEIMELTECSAQMLWEVKEGLQGK